MQKKRTCTTSQASDYAASVARAADAFPAAREPFLVTTVQDLRAVRTILLRRTSERVKVVVDKMRMPAIVRLSRSFSDDARNGTAAEKLHIVMRQLAVATARCRISTLELPRCEMK